MIDFPSEGSRAGLSPLPAAGTANAHGRACRAGGGGSHAREQLKRIRMKFESAIFHLSITSRRDPLTANRGTSARASPLVATGALGLVNQDISRGSDPSFVQVHGPDSRGSRHISSGFPRCYW